MTAFICCIALALLNVVQFFCVIKLRNELFNKKIELDTLNCEKIRREITHDMRKDFLTEFDLDKITHCVTKQGSLCRDIILILRSVGVSDHLIRLYLLYQLGLITRLDKLPFSMDLADTFKRIFQETE